MVYEELRILSEEPVEQVLILFRLPGHITHGIHAVALQLPGIALPHSPEVRKGSVVPELLPVAFLIQLCDTHAILICRDMLCHDIHGHLAEVQVAAYAGRSRDTGLRKHLQDDLHGKLVGGQAVGIQILRHIHEYLVDGIDDDVLRSDIPKIYLIDPLAVGHIVGHTGLCDNEVRLKPRICRNLRIEKGGTTEPAPGGL